MQESLLANSKKGSRRLEKEERKKEEIGRVAAKSSLSLYKLQILGGKPLGNLLISFNAIFRKIYAGPGEARLVEKVGRGQRASDGRGRDEFPERRVLVARWWCEGLERSVPVVRRRMIACLRRSFAKHRIHNIYHLPSGHLRFMRASQRSVT